MCGSIFYAICGTVCYGISKSRTCCALCYAAYLIEILRTITSTFQLNSVTMYLSHFSVGIDASCELLLFLYILDNQSQAVGLDSPQSQQCSNVTDIDSQGKCDVL